jgi:hypothetical protein
VSRQTKKNFPQIILPDSVWQNVYLEKSWRIGTGKREFPNFTVYAGKQELSK